MGAPTACQFPQSSSSLEGVCSFEDGERRPSFRHYSPLRRRCRSRLREGSPTGVHWVLSGIMAIEAKRAEQRQTSIGSKSQRVVQVTKFGTRAKQLLNQPRSKTRHDTAGQTANGEAGRACDRQHCGKQEKQEYPHGKWLRNNASCQRKERHATNYKHNTQAQRVTSQRKPTTTTKIQARHKQHSHNPTTSTSCQLSTGTTSRKEKKLTPNHHVVHACVGTSYRAKCSRGQTSLEELKSLNRGYP